MSSHCVYAGANFDFDVSHISSREGKAVIKDSKGIKRLIGIGDKLPGEMTVDEITENSVVFFKRDKSDIYRIIVTLKKSGQTVERISLLPEPDRPIFKPFIISEKTTSMPEPAQDK